MKPVNNGLLSFECIFSAVEITCNTLNSPDADQRHRDYFYCWKARIENLNLLAVAIKQSLCALHSTVYRVDPGEQEAGQRPYNNQLQRQGANDVQSGSGQIVTEEVVSESVVC